MVKWISLVATSSETIVKKNISIKKYKKTNNNNNKPWEDLLIMAYTGRLRRKGVSFSGLRYKRG